MGRLKRKKIVSVKRADKNAPEQIAASQSEASPAVEQSMAGAADLEKIVAESRQTLADAQPRKGGRPKGSKDTAPRKRRDGSDPEPNQTQEASTAASAEGAPLSLDTLDKQSVLFIAGGLKSLSNGIAESRGCAAWKRSNEQCEEIARPVVYLMAYYLPQLGPTQTAWAALAMAAGGWAMEGFEAEAEMKRKPVIVTATPVAPVA